MGVYKNRYFFASLGYAIVSAISSLTAGI